MGIISRRQQHEEIAEYLQDLIQSGELAPGDPLPSEAELCEKFDSSRGPVRQAVATLRADGLISSGRGRRSIVLLAPSTSSFDALLSVSALMKEQGRTSGGKILRIAREPADDRTARALQLEQGDPVVEVERVRSADGVPAVIERLVFPFKIGERLLAMSEDNESVHEILAQHGINADNAVRIGQITTATAEQATLLEIEEGAPLWHVELRASTFQGEHIEYAEYDFRGDMMRLVMSNVRGGPVPVKFSIIDPGTQPGDYGEYNN
ncbi:MULTISPECIES: GntR family transcriptional regulator [Corynebacterium]|uniref:GntR family transcriptional regulator n=1 Tax=Corynebacterium sp. CCUG 70398 TaxID=2823891 RepID=UPI00210EA5F8|nr:GntR family transcriptional regulator [Corynebacterium pseudogenitalium]MCQ4623168.1 GntR family transcriptional regulator [Corynebacterium sp. CCUG 70398]